MLAPDFQKLWLYNSVRGTLFDMKKPEIVSVVLAATPSRVVQLSLVVFFAMVLSSGRSLGANSLKEGDDWLKWSDETRLIYVSAYVSGHARGFRDGCEAGQRIYSVGKSKGLPGEKCIPESPTYSKYLESYVGMITEFYRTYSSDNGVPIWRLLDDMSDKRNLTLKQIHEYNGANARKPE